MARTEGDGERGHPALGIGLRVLVYGGCIAAPLAGAGPNISARGFWIAVLLASLSIFYAVSSRAVDRLRRTLAKGYVPNIQTTWILAAAIAVPSAFVPLIAAAALGAEWAHQHDSAKTSFDRKLFTMAAMAFAVQVSQLVAEHAAWPAVIAVLLAEIFDMVLVLSAAACRETPSVFCGRLRDMRSPRSVGTDVAHVALAAATGLLAALPGDALVLANLMVPVAVALAHAAARAEHGPASDETSGVYTPEAWEELATENKAVRYPAPVVVVVLPLGCGPTALRAGAELLRQAAPTSLVGRFDLPDAHAFAAFDPKVKHSYAATITQQAAEAGLREAGVAGAVELATIMDAADWRYAVDEATSVAARRLTTPS